MSSDGAPAANYDMIVLAFPREWIETGNIAPALAFLDSLVADRASVLRNAGKVVLSFEGYNDDARALDEVAEVRRWFQRLTERYPFWFLVCDRTTLTLPLVLNLLGAGTPSGAGGDRKVLQNPRDLAPILQMLFHAMDRLSEHMAIAPSTALAWRRDVTQCLDAFID